MKVEANSARSLSVCARVSYAGFGTRSTLLRTSAFLPVRTSASPRQIASSSAFMPRCASTRNATMSASCALPQAVPTMARSSRRRGRKMPGVSAKISCAGPSMAMPRMTARVVCTFGVTMEILAPTRALISVDLPTFGAPMSATTPQRVDVATASSGGPGSAIEARGLCLDALARQHRGGSGLLGTALGTAGPFSRGKMGQLNGDAEYRAMSGTGACALFVGRRGQAARLCPFLQDRLRIAQRLRRGLHAIVPQALDQLLRGQVAAVEINCADQRLADVGEYGRSLARAGIDFRRAQFDRGTEFDCHRDLRTGFLAHQIGQPPGQFS